MNQKRHQAESTQHGKGLVAILLLAVMIPTISSGCTSGCYEDDIGYGSNLTFSYNNETNELNGDTIYEFKNEIVNESTGWNLVREVKGEFHYYLEFNNESSELINSLEVSILFDFVNWSQNRRYTDGYNLSFINQNTSAITVSSHLRSNEDLGSDENLTQKTAPYKIILTNYNSMLSSVLQSLFDTKIEETFYYPSSNAYCVD